MLILCIVVASLLTYWPIRDVDAPAFAATPIAFTEACQRSGTSK